MGQLNDGSFLRRKTTKQCQKIVRFSGAESTTESPVTRTWTDTRNGEGNPYYREQIRNGRQAATIFNGERTTFVTRPYLIGQITNYIGSGDPPSNAIEARSHWGTITQSVPSDPSSISETRANNLALTRVVSKIRDRQTSFQGGVFIGELKQSIGLITNPARAIRGGFNLLFKRAKGHAEKYARGGKRGKQDLLNACADTWLEWNLGWAPLISEVDSAMKAIAESRIMETPRWAVVRAIANDDDISYGATSAGSTQPQFTVRLNNVSGASVRYIACIDVGTYALSSPQRVGLAPTNWAPTLWELIPYSFVIDYFANIGNIIDAASLNTSRVRWVVKTVRKYRTIESKDWHPIKAPSNSSFVYTLTTVLPGKLKMQRTTVHREPYTDSLVPDLMFNIDLGGKQWLNIAALYSQRKQLRSFTR